jgi:hypothetical protein
VFRGPEKLRSLQAGSSGVLPFATGGGETRAGVGELVCPSITFPFLIFFFL